MGTCTGKQSKRRQLSSSKDLQVNKPESAQQPSVQIPNNTTQLVSPCYQTIDDVLQLPHSQNHQNQDNNELRDQTNVSHLTPLSATIAQDISQEKEINKIEYMDKPCHQVYNQEEEEEKIDVAKLKNTFKSMDQSSTQITGHINDLASKKENQTSDTSSNNPIRQKKPTRVQSFDQGIVVQIFEPTQNSMEEAFSINEVDEEDMEEDEQLFNEVINQININNIEYQFSSKLFDFQFINNLIFICTLTLNQFLDLFSIYFLSLTD